MYIEKQIEATKWWTASFYPPSSNLFQKNKDANGVPYFNLAPNTFLTMQTSASVFLSAGSTSSIFVNGEFY
jgi:hypothetical protein